MNHANVYRWALCGLWLMAAVQLLPGQTYLPFLNRSQWFVEETGSIAQNFDWYHIGSDTLISGETFREVIAAGLPTGTYVREDVPAQQVWVTSAARNWTADLLYDFTALPGDTLALGFFPASPADFVVTGMDSVNTAMGFMRRLTLNRVGFGMPAQLRWAVGVGEEAHPFYLDYTGVSDPVYHLICNYQDRMKVFDDGFATCLPPPVVGAWEAVMMESAVEIFPNPATEMLTIALPEGRGKWRISVVDVRGVEVVEFLQQDAASLTIAVQNWIAGLYVIRMVDPKGEILVRKVVVR